jgi:DnaJ-class molecular chaperone
MSSAVLTQHRELLGLAAGAEADTAVLQAAYKQASVRAHPDHGGSNEAFRRVKEAAEALAKHAHEERWGTSSSSYGAAVAAGAQPLLLKQ